ncbi:MAG: hypothetical protein SF123_17515 [Chloroflexota bacterium]|nr:hypothetical protein [Chloroflexota bacterium]
MRRLLAILASVITIVVGIITIGDLTIGLPFSNGAVAAVFLRLAVITLAFLIMAGVLNLLIVHIGRIAGRERGFPYSIILLISAFAVVGLWLAGRTDINTILLNSVQVAIESSLAALVLFALVYGAYRLLHRRLSWAGGLFILTVCIMLVTALPLTEIGALTDVRNWLMTVPVSAGAHGILLGIALATIVTGVRILVGQDRSYRE